MSDSEDKAEPTAVKAEDEKGEQKNGDAKPKAEDADVKKKSDGDDAGEAKEEPEEKKEEKKKDEGDGDDDDDKEDSKKVTSAELRKRITAILKEADLEKTSAKKVSISIEGMQLTYLACCSPFLTV